MNPADLLAAIKNTPKMTLSLDELTCLRALLRLEYTTRVLGAVLDAADGKMSPEAVTEELLGTNQIFNTVDTPLAITESGAILQSKGGADLVQLPINAKVFDVLHDVANSTLLQQARRPDVPMSTTEAQIAELVNAFQPGLKAKFAEFAANFAIPDSGNVAGTDAPKANIPAPKSTSKALLN